MPGRVFISCGQATLQERRIAHKVAQWFEQHGFEPHVAIQAQSLSDINSGIIDQLKRADFYVFIDFRRERLVPTAGKIKPSGQYPYRGSLFTNQELAAAFILKFEHAIFLQQTGIELNGLLRYMGSNAQHFVDAVEVPRLIKQLVSERGWQPSYTRHLMLGATQWSDPLAYGDHTGHQLARVFYVDVRNRRPDVSALFATARLERIINPDGTVTTSIDRSPLKTTGQAGYAHTIWPETHVAWDFLAVHMQQTSSVYLHSALDVVPRTPIISAPGEYVLGYEVFASDFEALRFGIRLSVQSDPLATTAMLVESPAV